MTLGNFLRPLAASDFDFSGQEPCTKTFNNMREYVLRDSIFCQWSGHTNRLRGGSVVFGVALHQTLRSISLLSQLKSTKDVISLTLKTSATWTMMETGCNMVEEETSDLSNLSVS